MAAVAVLVFDHVAEEEFLAVAAVLLGLIWLW